MLIMTTPASPSSATVDTPNLDKSPTVEDQQSMSDSLSDYAASEIRSSPQFHYPSQHSGFRSNLSDIESEPGDSDSTGPWSPHALPWQQPPSGFFKKYDRLHPGSMEDSRSNHSPSRSRHSSPGHDDTNDVTIPANVPLPASPTKRLSPEATPEPDPQREPSRESSPAVAGIDEAPPERMDNCKFSFDILPQGQAKLT